MTHSLTARDRLLLNRIVASLPAGSPGKRLATVEKPENHPQIKELIHNLERVPGISDVSVVDTWNDGYVRLYVNMKTGDPVYLNYRANRFDSFYTIPNYQKISQAVRAVVRRSGVVVEGLTGPSKVYQIRDPYEIKRPGDPPPLSGFDDYKFDLQVYVSLDAL